MKSGQRKRVSMTGKSLTIRESLSFREALGILVDINVSHDEWGDLPLIAMVKPPTGQDSFPDPVALCKKISERSVKVLKEYFMRNDRRDRVAAKQGKPRKNSWNTIQRRGLLTDKVQYRLTKLSTRKIFDKALAVVQKAGWNPHSHQWLAAIFSQVRFQAGHGPGQPVLMAFFKCFTQ